MKTKFILLSISLFLFISHLYPQIPLDDLVAYYPFNGNANDESGNGYNGTNNGASLATDRFGNENSAYQFDGQNDFIYLPTPNIGQSDGMGSWACWFRTPDGYSSEYAQILDIFHAGGIHLAYGKAGGGMEIGYGDGKSVSDTANLVNDDQWHFVVLSYDNLNLRLHVDGELRDVVTDGVGQINYNGVLGIYLGVMGLQINYLMGYLDDVRLYSRALSEAEITELFYINTTPPDEFAVTFTVDMSNETISEEGVFLAGSFNDFDPSSTQMTDIGNGKYEQTLTLPAFENITFKYCNGNSIDFAEVVPETCGEDNGSGEYFRGLNLNSNIALPTVCFGECSQCTSLDEMVAWYPFNGNVNDESGNAYHASNSGATLANDRFGNENQAYYFNGTDQYIHLPTPNVGQENGLGTWSFWFMDSVGVSPEDEQFFDIFHAGGIALNYGKVLGGMEIGNGDRNYVYDTYPANDNQWHFVTLSYDNLNLRLYVDGMLKDMVTDGEGQIDYNGQLGIFLGMGGFGINHFKGYIDDVRIYNRPLSEDEIIELFYRNTTPPDEFNVTFKVDMSNENISEEGVFLAGSFNDFDPSSTQMTDIGNGKYEQTLTLPAFGNITFKYCNGNSIDFAEDVPESCGEDNGSGEFFRSLNLNSNITLPAVCFGECSQCTSLDEMVAWYPFNGNANDESGNGYDGINNGASLATDRFGNENSAYQFDGQNDFIYLPTPNIGQSDGLGTWACWFRTPDGYSSEYAQLLDIFHAGGIHLAYGKAGGGMEIGYGDGKSVSDTANLVNDDQWHFVVLSYDNLNLRLHVDGELRDMVSDGVGQIDYNGVLGIYLGVMGLQINYLMGYLDDVRLYDRALSQAEITKLFNENISQPTEVGITFQVDMSNKIISNEGVYISGSFNNFEIPGQAMTESGLGVYSTEVILPKGEEYSYRFINGISIEGLEVIPADCAEPDSLGNNNRKIWVQDAQVLEPVCFGECNSCLRDHTISLHEGWNSLSSYRLPDKTIMDTLMSQISNELVVIQTLTKAYSPKYNMLTLEDWNSQSAYGIKVSTDVTFTIAGTMEQNKTLYLDKGWNLIPYICEQPLDVKILFEDVVDDVIIIKELAGTNIYWPSFGINTIQNLSPSKAYLVKLKNPTEITFP